MTNHYKHLFFLCKTMVLALFFYSLSRLIFFFYTKSLFPLIHEDGICAVFASGIRFDLSTFAYLNIFFIILLLLPLKARSQATYQTILKILFVFFNGCVMLLNMADIVNVLFTEKRMTSDILMFISQGEDAKHLAIDFARDNWYLFLFFILLITGLFIGYNRLQKKLVFSTPTKSLLKSSLASLFMICLTILAMRGGTQLRPIRNIHASTFGQGRYVPLILNTPFSILSTLGEKGLEKKKYFDQQESHSYFNAIKSFKSDSVIKDNVVVIVLESFAKEYIGFYNQGIGYTPFLDSLMEHSLVCSNAYANGKKSIEGIPAVLSGIPALTNKPFILSKYGSQKSNSLARLLSAQSYDCSFYHGGNPGTMGFEAYAQMSGFDHYVDRSQYPKKNEDYDGKWGVFDEPFFQFFKSELDQKKTPFLASIFSLSSHHPYSIPEKYSNKFPRGEIPIHECIGYTDFALRAFFSEAKKSTWFDQTIFVITADHTFKSTRAEYQNVKGRYAIPLVFYSPTKKWTKNINKVTQQADIIPSLIDYLGIDTSIVSFGNSIWSEQGFAVNYLNNIYQFFEGDYLLQFNGEKSLGLYHLKSDFLLEKNLILKEEETKNELEQKLKSYIQEYHERLINNKLEIDD